MRYTHTPKCKLITSSENMLHKLLPKQELLPVLLPSQAAFYSGLTNSSKYF